MSKQIYEEAIADVNKVKEIAEDNAKRAVLEAVVPRIRDFIEKSLLGESEEDMLNDDAGEGAATLDLDALATDPAGSAVEASQFGSSNLGEYELNAESVEALGSLSESHEDFENQVSQLSERLGKFKKASKFLRESNGYQSHITQMIANVEDMYDYVQGSVGDPKKKNAYEVKLEALFQDLNTIQESAEMSKNRKLNEEDVTLKLTGLPDEIDLDAIGVDLITGEDEDGEGGDELSLDGDLDDDGMGDQGGEGQVDFGDMGGDDETQLEADDLSDDTMVEIDENMLRTEIAKMRKLREESKMSADVLDDFGGGKDEGDQFVDGEVRTEGVEGDEETVDEVTTSMTTSNRAMHEDDDCGDMPMESLKHKLALETKLIVRAKARAQKIKEQMANARLKKNLKLEGSLRKELALAVNRINEATARYEKIKGQATKGKSLNETRENRGSRVAEESLRTKLTEANLNNVKLMFANKLLQNDNLSTKQKSQAIKQLDEATSTREAKLVYESLTKTLPQKSLREGTESRQVLGSSSRATRPASTQIVNEGAVAGFEIDRWAKIAGIK